VLNRLLGVTLWCKTLVLRKDKVTHCSALEQVYKTKIGDTKEQRQRHPGCMDRLVIG